MQKFTLHEGVAAPLLRANVDTDVIIRIERLLEEPRESLGRYALEPLRYRPDGAEDPDFVLNQPAYRGASILLAGHNFGCGSSREAAVWALWGLGIRCIMAPSFGDIFFGNCFQSGLLPIRLPEDTVRGLAEEADGRRFLVDLQNLRIRSPSGREIPFDVDANQREALLQGLDEIALTLRRDRDIAAFQRTDRERRPWVYI